MGEANEGGRSRGLMENFSLEKYPRDLLKRFMCTDQQSSSQNAASFRGGGAEEEQEEEEDSEELELNLGLSLGGRFGVDKTMKSKKLTRSSSIIGTMPIARDSDDSAALVQPVSSYRPLVRTSSLPTETEEEWRKRKELQTLRRMAAKRRRSEKQRHPSGKAERDDEERDKQQYLASLGAPSTPGARVDLTAKTRQLTSQGSVESHGGGSSSGMSEFESKPVQGSSSCGETRSPAGQLSLQERSQEIMSPSGTKTTENKCSTSGSKMENPFKKPSSGGNKGREIGMNAMEDMPCVFTKGDGPNGRRIDGILYRYGKGADVRIMCVCHGDFLSPAEFVKHAGGGDVDHPLRHIVINPSTTAL